METVFIYTLSHPISREVRYVGKTNNLQERYKSHLNPAHKTKSHKANWIKSLRKEGLKPIINIIDIVPEDEWQFWEQYWYWQLRSWGFDLINHTTCGEGLTLGNNTSFKRGNKAKKVIALSYDKKIMGKYFSVTEAINKTGLKHIPNALKKTNQFTAGKMLWYYKEEYLLLTNEKFIEDVKKATDMSNKGGKDTCFKKGVNVWNKGITGYTTSKKGQVYSQKVKDKILQTIKNKSI